MATGANKEVSKQQNNFNPLRSWSNSNTPTNSASTRSVGTSDFFNVARSERAFTKELPDHPPKLADGVAWPRLIQEEAEVGAAFCLDIFISQDQQFHAAVGYGSGDVKCSGWIDTCDMNKLLAKASAWPIAYRHVQEPSSLGPARVTCVAFSPNGEWVGSSSWDGTVMLYHLSSKRVLRTERLVDPDFKAFDSIRHESCTNQVAWDPDSARVLVAVSRVRKFQGQTNPKTIPGAIVDIEVPRLGHELKRDQVADHDDDGPADHARAQPAEVEVLQSNSQHGLWCNASYELPACWCISVTSVENQVATSALSNIRSHQQAARTSTTEEPLEGRTEKSESESIPRSSRISSSSARSSVSDAMTHWVEDATLLVAVGCGNAEVRVFAAISRPTQGFKFCASLVGHRSQTTNGGVWDVRFLPIRITSNDSRESSRLRLASAGEDHQIIIWDVVSECQVSVLNQASQGFGVVRIRCFVDEKPRWDKGANICEQAFKVCAGEQPDPAMHWECNTSWTASLDDDWIASEGNGCKRLMIVSASWDNSVTLWDVESSSVVSVYNNIHTDAVFDLATIVHKATHPPCSMLCLCTVSRDKKLKLWNYEIGSIESTTKMSSKAIVGLTMLHTPPGFTRQVVATASNDGGLCAMDLKSGRRLTEMKASTGHICSLTTACACDGSLAYGDNEGSAHVVRPSYASSSEVEFGGAMCSLQHDPPKPAGLHELNAVCWVPSTRSSEQLAHQTSQLLVGVCTCKKLFVWQLGVEKPINVEELRSPCRSLCSRDATDASGTVMLSGCEDGIIYIWKVFVHEDKPRLKPCGELHGHNAAVVTLCFASDGTHVASGGWDCLTILWHLSSKTMVRVLRGHTQNVTSVVFNPFSTELISASWDRKLLVWNVGTTTVKRVFLGPEHPISALCVSKDGKWMASADTGGFVMVRPLNSPTVSLLLVWRSFFYVVEKLSAETGGRKEGLQLVRAFIAPPSTVCHSLLFPFRTTLLHSFANSGDLNAIKCIHAAYSLNDSGDMSSAGHIGLKRDVFGRLPIDWAIEGNHMDCVDEFLQQASKCPWQMAEILSASLPRICERSIRMSYPFRSLPVFLDSRLMPPLPSRGMDAPNMPSSHHLPPLIARGTEMPSLGLDFYGKLLGIPKRHLNPEGGGTVVRAKILFIPHALELISNLNRNFNVSPADMDPQTIQSDAWEAVTECLWVTIYRPLYIGQFIEYMCYLIFCLTYLLMFKTTGVRREATWKLVHGSLVLLLNLAFLVGEAAQLFQEGFRHYCASMWNYLQVLSYMLLSIFVLLDFLWASGGEPIMVLIGSMAGFTAVSNMLYYFRGVQSLSIVIRIISRIIISLRYYILILLTITTAFVLAFWMLIDFGEGARRLPELPDGFNASICPDGPIEDGETIMNLWQIMETAFTVGMLGEDRVHLLMATIERSSTLLQVAVWSFFFVYICLGAIVMLNLLVAVMNHEYDQISKQSLVEAKRERWAMMDDLDSSYFVRLLLSAVTFGRSTRQRKQLSRYLAVHTDKTQEGNTAKKGAVEEEAHTGKGDSAQDPGGRDLDMRISALMVSHFAELERLLSGLNSGGAGGDGHH